MDMKSELLKFNDFLNDVYSKPIKLSDILNSNSFSGEEIYILKNNGIEQLLYNIEIALKCKFISSSNKIRLYQVIRKRYGLFGCDKLTLREIAPEMNISHERVRQLEKKAIKYIKPNKRGDFLAMAIVISACQLLNVDVTTRLMQNDEEICSRKDDFHISFEEIQKFELSYNPITMSEIVSSINFLADNENMKRITTKHIEEWLLSIEMLTIETMPNGKTVKRPTQHGINLGISIGTRYGARGAYSVVLYDSKAQRFIVDNIDAVMEFIHNRLL